MDYFSIDQTAEVLDLPPAIVDKLVRSGQLPSATEGVAADEIQKYLSACFIRLFQAQALPRLPRREKCRLSQSSARYRNHLAVARRIGTRQRRADALAQGSRRAK